MHLDEILLRVHGIKGLRFVGLSAYKLCTHVISSLLFHSPEIRSLYLAGSMASGDFVPGLSDIDIIVVISEMSPEKEYTFLKGLERKLKYLMPPYGKYKIGTHVFVYSVKEWSLLGDLSAGRKFGRPLKLFEKATDIFTRRYDTGTKALQHFYKAAWRLESIQDNLSSPVKSALDLRSRQRTIERCLQSILHGLKELNAGALPFTRFTELKDRIVRLQNRSRESDKPSSLYSLLPQVMYIFDIAIRNGSGSTPGDPELADASNNVDVGLNINTVKRQAAELYNNIFETGSERMGKSHELTICRTTNDYFIYDLGNHEISEQLIQYYAANKKSGLRMMSPYLLNRLYLNFPTVSYTFIRFPECKVSKIKGRPDRSRLLIETYSILPQLRATAKRQNPETYKSLSNWTHHIIRSWDIERNGASSSPDEMKSGEAEYSDINAEEEKEFERFTKLKSLSLVLTGLLDEATDTQSRSDSRECKSERAIV